MSQKAIYILIACIVTLGAGAAVGIVLSNVEGDISVAVNQALLIEKPSVTTETGDPWPYRHFTSVNDDRSKFTATVEAGDNQTFVVNVPLMNLSTAALGVILTLAVPGVENIEVDVEGSGVIPSQHVIRADSATWKFVVPGGAAAGTPPVFDGIMIKVTTPVNVGLGFYHMEGQFTVLAGSVRLLPVTTPPSVTTNDATNITTVGATLNGNLTSLGTASSVSVSFQWGTSPGVYPNSTNPQAMSTTGAFSFDLTGLNPGMTYYFRAVAIGDGTSYGAEKSFTTLGTVLYLHNNPTPPTGDTNTQANLPMNASAPTAATLYNYDMDKNSDPGRAVRRGGSGAGETNLDYYQNWQMPVTNNLSINGNVDIVLWSILRNDLDNKRGTVTVYLRDFNGSSYTEIGNSTLDLASWQQGSTNWVERTITISGVNYTIASGHILEVKVIVEETTWHHSMRFAYDTTSYPSRVVLP